MRFTSHLFLRVEPAMPVAIAAAAQAEGIGQSEFVRRAVLRALGDEPPVSARKPRRCGVGRLRLETTSRRDPDRDPPHAGPAAQMPVAA